MQATVRLELTTAGGAVVEVREAKNSVMRAGAELIASLFAGKATAGITHMAVGTSSDEESDSFNTGALANDDEEGTPALTGGIETAIGTSDFTLETDTARKVVRVRVRATLPNAAAVGTMREAGLMAKGGTTPVLYNRVVFAPIEKKNDHELTMFWEVTFPYGDLNWM
jgi:hypothetical protein